MAKKNTKVTKRTKEQPKVDMHGYTIVTCLIIACAYFVIVIA